jgi:hypothetical protein
MMAGGVLLMHDLSGLLQCLRSEVGDPRNNILTSSVQRGDKKNYLPCRCGEVIYNMTAVWRNELSEDPGCGTMFFPESLRMKRRWSSTPEWA